MNILNKLAKLLKNYPMKVIFIMIIIVIISAAGIRNVFMATGNDTLVKTNTDVYQDNEMLEQEFGGESVIVLYESDNLLTPDHLEHMKGIENALKTSNSIYSIISPVTLVEEIANKQADVFQEGIIDIIEGLDEMGSQLAEIGGKLKENASNNLNMQFPNTSNLESPKINDLTLPELGETELPGLGENVLLEFGNIPNMEEQMDELNKGFSNMIEAQENLETGTKQLVGGYATFSEQTNALGESLATVAAQLEDTPQKEQIKVSSQRLTELSKQMLQLSEGSEQLPVIPVQTMEGLNHIQHKLNEQLQEQKIQREQMQGQIEQQKEMQAQLQVNQQEKQHQISQEIQKQQETKQNEMKAQIQKQQAEKETQMQDLQKEIQGKQEEQIKELNTLGEGLIKMGEQLQTISENMETIYDYADIMTPGLPKQQATLDNMVYDDGELRPVFEEVIVDDQHMLMMIKFNGGTDDTEKSEVVETINNYLDNESIDSLETLVSGKPVLDNAIRSSMQQNIQKMMGLAILIMVVVLFFVFKVQWRLLPLLTVLIAVIGTIGVMAWLQIPITMVSMAVFPILIGLGIDYAIQFQNRYSEEMAEEDLNE